MSVIPIMNKCFPICLLASVSQSVHEQFVNSNSTKSMEEIVCLELFAELYDCHEFLALVLVKVSLKFLENSSFFVATS